MRSLLRDHLGDQRARILVVVQLALLGNSAIIVAIFTTQADDTVVLDQVAALTGALLVTTIAAVLIPWRRINTNWPIVIGVLDLAIIALLRDTLFDYQRSVSILAIIPVIWLSFQFGRRVVAIAIVGDFFISLYPFIRTGEWPTLASDWSNALTPAVTGSIVAVAVHVAARLLERQSTRLDTAREDLRVSVADGLDGDIALQQSVDAGTDAASAALTVMDTVDAGITFYAPDGSIILANATSRELLESSGVRSDAAPLIFEGESTTPMSRDDYVLALARRGELVTRRAYRIGIGTGQRTVMTTSQYVKRANGELLGTVVATHDVTPLAEAIRSRDNFLETVSHELRTPLTSIIGYLEVIEDAVEGRDVGIDDELAIVQRNSNRLLRLISDLLTTAEGQGSLERRSMNISELAARSLEAARSAADRRGIRIIPPTLVPVIAEVDADHITDVFDKIFSNSVKFTQAGGTIALSMEQSPTDAVVRITDTGSGMTDDDASHIFERFFRSSTTRSDVVAGAGLGLSSAKVIVEAHKGTITVSSGLGVGTTIEVRLPLHA